MSARSCYSRGLIVVVAVLLVVSAVPAAGAAQVVSSEPSPVDVGGVTGAEGVDGSQVVVPVVDPPVRDLVNPPRKARVEGRVKPVVVPVWSENRELDRSGVPAGVESRVWVSGEPGELVFSVVPVRVLLGERAFDRAVVSVRAEVLDAKDAGVVSPFGLAIGLEFWAGTERVVPSGPVQVEVSYEDVGLLTGGDAAGRMRLVAFSDCDRDKGLVCGDAMWLGSVNDPTARTVSAVVDPGWLGSGVLALGAGPSGPSSDFTATPLLGVGSYQVGVFSGAAELSYPIELPAAAAGPAPSVVLSYSSGAVDGLHSSTNNQPGWVGLGWGYEPGAITRHLKSCDDTGNLCLAGDEYSIFLNGVSERLVQDTGDDDLFSGAVGSGLADRTAVGRVAASGHRR